MARGSQLGSCLGGGAPGDGVVEAVGGSVDVVGEVHVADLLLPTHVSLSASVGVAGGEGGVQSRPADVVDPLGAEEQQLAAVVERVTLPAAVLEGGLLDALAAAGHRLVGEAP